MYSGKFCVTVNYELEHGGLRLHQYNDELSVGSRVETNRRKYNQRIEKR